MCNPQCENKSTIIALQGLRAIAFLGIFLSHRECPKVCVNLQTDVR